MRRGLCLALAGCWLLFCAGCSSSGNEPVSDTPATSVTVPDASGEAGVQSFGLAYSSEDTLNPFATATEVNLELAGLLYEGLTAVDGTYTVQNALAGAVAMADPTHWTATLRGGAVFCDGTEVTPQDVVSSFQQAKNSAHYNVLLGNVVSAAADKKTGIITFTLAAADPNTAACLCFPVVKVASLTTAAQEAPLGTGLYVFTRAEDGTASLTANPHAAIQPRFSTVRLSHLPNSSSMYYSLEAGEITFYYNDLSSGDIPRVSNASTSVDMNDLVFLGVNSGRAALADAAVRRSLSLALDRKIIASSAYSGWATAATLPFTPRWGQMNGVTGLPDSRDLNGAVTLLGQAGYSTGSSAEDKNRLKLELIYNSDNSYRSAAAELIRSQLEGLGVEITVTPLDYAEYENRLRTGSFDLYIGEVRLTADMSLRPFLMGGKASYGVATGGVAATAYAQYLEGAMPLQDFVTAFAEDLPYLPLCWRSGFAAYNRRLATVTPTAYNVFYGFAQWH